MTLPTTFTAHSTTSSLPHHEITLSFLTCGLGHVDRLKLELVAEAERRVPDEGRRDDEPLEDVNGAHVRDNAASRLVIVDDGTVNKTLGDDRSCSSLQMTSWCTQTGVAPACK
ncbi:hypothetical protein NDU88_002212 [Pleurodeles waltl]|uniref:Uncharacterized protein n=1 Tax=Pleurodeles waltl TaxID=8319 RepID=A0AAV7VD67_PLEWA|nr:hypothetical protein NDU88_002212 [Pleurodeles waltl]